MKQLLIIATACMAMLAACSPEPAPAIRNVATAQQPQQPQQPQLQPAVAPLSIEGRWRILSIDGRPPAVAAAGERAPVLSFTDYSLGGSVGCNSFGGLGLLVDGHFAIHSWGGTAMGCQGPVGEQERAISQLFFARPRVSVVGPARLRVESDAHSVELERLGTSREPRVPAGPEELANTSWRVGMMDGQEASVDPLARTLRFGSGTWQGTVACATLSGTWRRDRDRIIVGREIASTEQLCPPRLAQIDAAFADLMRSNPRYLVGPNGEFLLAGGGHALAGGRS